MKCAYCSRHLYTLNWDGEEWRQFCRVKHSLLPCDGEGHYTDEQGKQHKCKIRKTKKV